MRTPSDNPDAYDLDRKSRSSLDSDFGPHMCIGAVLLRRLELNSAINGILESVPHIFVLDPDMPRRRLPERKPARRKVSFCRLGLKSTQPELRGEIRP